MVKIIEEFINQSGIARYYFMQKISLLKIAAINIAIFWAITPSAFAGEDGIALIAQGKGDFSCGNENQISDVNLFVLLSEKTRLGLGTGPSGMGLKSADDNQSIAIKLTSGEMNSNDFSVVGILQVDNLCGTDFSVSYAATGSCGDDQTITIKGSDGSFGTFQANVSCRA